MSVLIMMLRPHSIASYQSEDRTREEKNNRNQPKPSPGNSSDFFTLARLPLANTQGEGLIIITVFFKPDMRSGFRFYQRWAVRWPKQECTLYVRAFIQSDFSHYVLPGSKKSD